MKRTFSFLLVSLLLAFTLTACGGGSGQSGYARERGGITGDNYAASDNRSNYQNNTANGTTRGAAGRDSSLAGDTRDALDDAGRAVRRTVDDAGQAINRAMDR